MPLPSGLAYGRVTLQNIVGIADSADADDEPDIITMGGTVVFTPSIKDASLVGGGTTQKFFLREVSATIGSDGILRNLSGAAFVSLLATDSPGLTKTGWKWTAVVNWSDGGKDTITFQLPGGTVLNLATVFTPVEGDTITVFPAGTLLTEADLDSRYALKTDENAGVSQTQLNDAITAHADASQPHRAYDVDMQDLITLFENGMA